MILEVLKLLDWYTEMWKVYYNKSAAKEAELYGWLVILVLVSTALLGQRLFDQLWLLHVASGSKNYPGRCFILIIFFPVAPLTLLSALKIRGDRTLFKRRPLSTLMFGFPFASVYGVCAVDAEVVMHPVQMGIRILQNIYQQYLEDVPSIVIDIVVIERTWDSGKDLKFFWISLCVSITHFLLMCFAVALGAVVVEQAKIQSQDKQQPRVEEVTSGQREEAVRTQTLSV